MDKIVPTEEAMEFDKFIPNNKVLIIEGVDHNKVPKNEKTKPNRTGSIGFWSVHTFKFYRIGSLFQKLDIIGFLSVHSKSEPIH